MNDTTAKTRGGLRSIQVWVRDQERRELKAIAARRGQTMAQILRGLIVNELGNKRETD